MTSNASSPTRQNLWTVGTLAGFAGGIMEVVWIMLYQSLSGHDAAIVAKGVTESVFPDMAAAPSSVAIGLVIHMVLAIGLGIVIAIAVPLVLPRIAGDRGSGPCRRLADEFLRDPAVRESQFRDDRALPGQLHLEIAVRLRGGLRVLDVPAQRGEALGPESQPPPRRTALAFVFQRGATCAAGLT